MNIIGYVRKNTADFGQAPLNEVDSLVFAELAYMSFARAQCSLPNKTLGELCQDIDKLLAGTLSVLHKHNVQLLKAISASPRFAPVKVGFFRQRNCDAKEQRFAAVTFMLCDGAYHIAFRGTGVSLVGWRENLKMSLLDVIPTQRIALAYLEEVLSRLEGSFTVGGLSKGGNLSVFSATFARSDLQQRIAAVYNHDGPGFNFNIFEDERYQRIAQRVRKTVPHDSIVGMLLTASQVYEVVDSTNLSIAQHDPFSWVVRDMTSFKKLPKTTHGSRATDTALSEWIASMDMPTRRRFVNAVFAIVHGSGATEVGDFLYRPLQKIRLMRKAFDALPDGDKQLISHGGKQLLSRWFGEIFAFARRRAPHRE